MPALSYDAECRRARGLEAIPDEEAPISILGALCDYSARGSRRAHWFRLVCRAGSWSYLSAHLRPVSARASDRHQGSYGNAWAGELLAQHDRGADIDHIWLVTTDPDNPLLQCEFSRRRDGQLSILLPDSGSPLVLPDPRRPAKIVRRAE